MREADRPFRVFATCDIGSEALELLRARGYEVEVYPGAEPPAKSLIVEKLRSGIDALITTLRDCIDEEVFEAGRGTLKVVAQYAVGFDNIDRAAASRRHIPFTNTADVLTEATAEFALFILGNVARKLCPSERLVRDNRWGIWHPYLPFLGDEVTGKTIAVIGTGRIGQAFIKKAVAFDVDFLCYDGGVEDHEFARKIQEAMDVRFRNGFTPEQRTIAYASFEEALRGADFVSVHVPLVREGEGKNPTYHLFNEKTLRWMKPSAFLVNTARGAVVDEKALVDNCRRGAGCLRTGTAARGFSLARSKTRKSRAPLLPFRQRRTRHAPLHQPRQRDGGPLRAGRHRRSGRPLRRQPCQHALRGEQRSVQKQWLVPSG